MILNTIKTLGREVMRAPRIQPDSSTGRRGTIPPTAATSMLGGSLVNNAGVLRVGALADLPVRDVERTLPVNLHGPLLMSKVVLPAMIRRGSEVVEPVRSEGKPVGDRHSRRLRVASRERLPRPSRW